MSIDYAAAMNTVTTIKEEASKGDQRFLKTSTYGNKIRLRFIPDWKTIEKTGVMATAPYHHASHKWHDASGRLFVRDCLRNIAGVRDCPMCEAGFTDAKSNDAVIRARGIEMRPSQDHYVNVYVVSDLKNPTNNGQVRVLRMGKTLYEKYVSATTGDYAPVYGDKIWRLGKGGCTFNLTAERAGAGADGKEYPTYANSAFLPVEISDGDVAGLTNEKINELCGQVFELPALFPQSILSEIKTVMNEHYYNVTGGCDSGEGEDDPEEGVVMTKKATETVAPAPAATKTTNPTVARDPNPEPPVMKPAAPIPGPVATSSGNVSDDELNKLLGI